MGEELIHGTVPNAKGKYVSRDFLRNQFKAMFSFSGPKDCEDLDREYDLIFTSKRLIRAKLSDAMQPGFFGLLTESVSLFSRVGTGAHKDYKNEREKYQTMSPHQILSADEYNIEILYSDVESVWFGKIGKIVGFNLLTTTHYHIYNFPSVYLESTKQLINTFFPDKYVDEAGQIPEF